MKGTAIELIIAENTLLSFSEAINLGRIEIHKK
jgi:hypothetical protein